MNQEFKQCLESKKIIPFARGKKLVEKELSIAQSDRSDAKAGFENQRYKWSTIQAYYAVFHTPFSLRRLAMYSAAVFNDMIHHLPSSLSLLHFTVHQIISVFDFTGCAPLSNQTDNSWRAQHEYNTLSVIIVVCQ